MADFFFGHQGIDGSFSMADNGKYGRRQMLMSENYKYFQNTDCEYYPCHKIKEGQEFNCLFCYCPLYALGEECGGNFTYTKKGVKNCTHCDIPHVKENYDKILEKLDLVVEMAKKP